MVNLLEIDEVLSSIPGVADAAAASFSNRWVDEEIAAVIVPKAGVTLTEDAVLHDCRRKVPFAESPKVIQFVDSVPRTPTGKIMRAEVAERFAQLQDRLYYEREPAESGIAGKRH